MPLRGDGVFMITRESTVSRRRPCHTGVANKYTCGLITQDDGNEDIFYMTRGEAGLALSEGLRVTYERTTNTRGPIAHYVKVRDAAWTSNFKVTRWRAAVDAAARE